MGKEGAVEAIVTIATAIVGVAILAVLVSQKSNTSAVIQSFGSAFTNALGVAEAPVTGANYSINTSYPSNSNQMGITMPSFGGMGGY